MRSVFNRILLKMSGEALAGNKGYGIHAEIAKMIASEIKTIHSAGIEIAIVIGGGNIFRGVAAASKGFDRVASDTVGMLATLMNSLVFKEYLQNIDVEARVLSAFKVEKAAEFYIPHRAKNHLKNGRIVIIAGGTGNPYFTTDTAAALRCAEIKCNVLLKATKVDGIYDSDPVSNPNAVKLSTLTHGEALQRDIKVMDSTAFSLCMENNIPIVVFKLLEPGNLRRCVEGKPVGSTVKNGV